MSWGDERLLVKSFKCPKSLARDLEWLAEVLGITQSDVIRLGIALLVKSLDNNGHSRIKVKHVVLEPPTIEEIEHSLGGIKYKGVSKGVRREARRPTCEEMAVLKYQYNKSWSEIAEYYGYSSKYSASRWFRRYCNEKELSHKYLSN